MILDVVSKMKFLKNICDISLIAFKVKLKKLFHDVYSALHFTV